MLMWNQWGFLMLTHKPYGLKVLINEGRSFLKMKAKALKVLRATKAAVDRGDWSCPVEIVRTYDQDMLMVDDLCPVKERP